jgi:hypothetical protein
MISFLDQLRLSRCLITLDCEYVHELMNNDAPQRPDTANDVCAVLQIGAVLWHDGAPVEQLNVRVVSDLQLSERGWLFFESLTGQKQSSDDAVSFAAAMALLNGFITRHNHNGCQVLIMKADHEVVGRQCARLALTDCPDTSTWFRLQPMLAAAFSADAPFQRMSSGELHALVGLEKADVFPGGQVHDAVFDALSMGYFVHRYRFDFAQVCGV